ARDEAHRFANKGRKKVGKRRRFASRLDDVPGIGPKTRTALLTALGSVDGIRRAPDDAVLAVKGVSHKTLEVLRKHLGRESDDLDALEDDGVLQGDTGEVDGVPENGSPEMTNVDAAENVTTEVDESASPLTDGTGFSVGGGSG
ncbi:MAG TPA: helix-hairpin-helix domain-containing protein, partial [Polyangiaceae bacterium]